MKQYSMKQCTNCVPGYGHKITYLPENDYKETDDTCDKELTARIDQQRYSQPIKELRDEGQRLITHPSPPNRPATLASSLVHTTCTHIAARSATLTCARSSFAVQSTCNTHGNYLYPHFLRPLANTRTTTAHSPTQTTRVHSPTLPPKHLSILPFLPPFILSPRSPY